MTLKKNILIANDSPALGRLIAKWLKKERLKCVCSSSLPDSVKKACAETDFSAVIIFHYSECSHTCEVIAEIKREYPEIKVIVADLTADNSQHRKLFSAGADRCLVMPFPLDRIAVAVTESIKGCGYDDVITMIPEFLASYGFQRNLDGFDYLAYAMELCILSPSKLTGIVAGLYHEIADHFSTDWTRVERSMRNLANKAEISGAFRRMTDGLFSDKPTNYEMICGACDAFALRYNVYGIR